MGALGRYRIVNQGRQLRLPAFFRFVFFLVCLLWFLFVCFLLPVSLFPVSRFLSFFLPPSSFPVSRCLFLVACFRCPFVAPCCPLPRNGRSTPFVCFAAHIKAFSAFPRTRDVREYGDIRFVARKMLFMPVSLQRTPYGMTYVRFVTGEGSDDRARIRCRMLLPCSGLSVL